jgi:copper chaperone
MSAMASFIIKIRGMTCDGCVSAVERIIKKSDPNALMQIDLASGQVHLTTQAPFPVLAQALATAGYEAQAL